ncbi:MAG: hypothetical protein II964_08665 [Synergistaceae bacterium]|nr:hypothetical protein [Synergistaceae bacterium]
MRIFKGLENIHSVIDRHETEWRIEQGEDPERLNPESIEERVRRRLTAQPDSGSGRFDGDRFLKGNTKPVKQNETSEPVTPPESENSDSGQPKGGKFSADRFFSGNSDLSISPELQTAVEPETESEPEAVEIIKNKDGKHSWLYNEVMKAINDAAKGSKAKIIAVFIPVVQNGKEFEDLPADVTLTTSTIDESLAKVETVAPDEPSIPAENETSSEDFNLIPEIQPEQKAEIAETLREMEEKFDEELQEEKESEPEIVEEETLQEIPEEEPLPEIPEEEPLPEIVEEEPLPEIPEDDSQPEVSAEDTQPEIIPEIIIDEPLPENEITPAITAEESETDNDDDDIQEGEVMESEELPLIDELNDDEVFDESLTEILKPDDDETLVADGEGFLLPAEDEVEIIPDPKH